MYLILDPIVVVYECDNILQAMEKMEDMIRQNGDKYILVEKVDVEVDIEVKL